MDATITEGMVCKPNISGPGRRRRRNAAIVFALVGLATFAAGPLLHWAWYLRALTFLPVAMAVVSYLQVTRNTCVAHAARGTFEHEDFSTTKMADDDVAASRKVARTIQRDGALAGLVVGALAAATTFLG